jgi:hypothetical protein
LWRENFVQTAVHLSEMLWISWFIALIFLSIKYSTRINRPPNIGILIGTRQETYMAVSNEPVAIGGLINSAAVSTIAILLYFKVDPQLVGAISVALSGWIAAISAVVRTKVTPSKNVALTNTQVTDINIARSREQIAKTQERVVIH